MPQEKTRRALRSAEEVLEDFDLGDYGLRGFVEIENRLQAIVEVLRSIPKEDYAELLRKYENNEFQWFIPPYEQLGGVHAFGAKVFEEEEEYEKIYANVLYLSPRLEELDPDIAIAVVAHELAHIALGHRESTDEAQEGQAWKKVQEWGFNAEKYREFRKQTRKTTPGQRRGLAKTRD